MKEHAQKLLAYLQDNSVGSKELFKTLTSSVEVEISSACNRRCAYCPQSLLGRNQELMPASMFEKIVTELSEIEYKKDFSFHMFNEPLLAKDYLLECMKQVKDKLPHASMNIFSNGDLLTVKGLQELATSGASSVMLTCHFAKDEQWSIKAAFAKMKELCARLGIACDIKPMGESLFCLSNVGQTEVWIMAPDLLRHGSNRLGTVAAGSREQSHSKPCSMMFGSFDVSYSGAAYLCCEFCHGIPEQTNYALGSVEDLSIFEILERKKNYMVKYLDGNMPECCKNCKGH